MLQSFRVLCQAFLVAFCVAAPPAQALPGDDAVLEAREALRKKDRARLAALRQATASHPLAAWVEYWELGNRLVEAQQPELDAFYARWRGTYVEDRLRNDWLLELGRRRDWANLRADFPRFRMNDDREVTCYALLAQHLAGADVHTAARTAWFAQRDADDGCQLMAATLFEAKLFSAEDARLKARQAVENNRPRAARAALALADPVAAADVPALFDNPARFLASPPSKELALLALMRVAANDPEAAAGQLEKWQARLGTEQAALAWASAAKHAALKLLPAATDYVRRAWKLQGKEEPAWSDDTLAWHARAALRSGDKDRWALVARAIGAMGSEERRDATWVYWLARAQAARARPGTEGDAARAESRLALEGISTQLNFYGQLALEDLGGRTTLPAPPPALAAAELEAARSHPGMARALQLIAIGLRSEGVREWNFSLRGFADRELLAAAQLACEREVWDRCINTSDRTRTEVDMAQRYPTPFREQVRAVARDTGVDPAYMYGLIRQESRFIMDARSSVGASGLMQLMPATARWTAKKIGLDYRPEVITDRDVNLRLGAAYLKIVLDDFAGSQAMAAAAYNAGPGRPRRWREGGTFEPAAWAESIPLNETRDYVKKVLSNAVYYAALLGGATPSLKARLGRDIGPRDPTAPGSDKEIP